MRLPHSIVVAALTAALVVAACDSKTPSTPASPSLPQPAPVATLQTVAEAPVSGPITNVTAGSTGTFNYAGQSVYVPAGTYTQFRFQWYSTAREAVAFGRLHILTQEFLGLPGDLPSAAGRLIASTAIEAGEYVFEPSSEFQGDRTYWFYTDTQGSFATSFDIDTYAPGNLYLTGIFSQPFRRTQASGRMVNGVFVPAPPGVTVDANFRLRGARK